MLRFNHETRPLTTRQVRQFVYRAALIFFTQALLQLFVLLIRTPHADDSPRVQALAGPRAALERLQPLGLLILAIGPETPATIDRGNSPPDHPGARSSAHAPARSLIGLEPAHRSMTVAVLAGKE